MFKFAATLVVLGVASQRAAAQISWAKSGGTNVCAGVIEDNGEDTVYFGNCNSDKDTITEYISMSNNALFTACDLTDYYKNSNNFKQIDATGTPVTCSELESGQTIPGQDCEYAFTSGAAYIGTSTQGGAAATAYYINTGTGDCKTKDNTFFAPPSGTVMTCADQTYCIGTGAGDACAERTFDNSAVKFSAYFKLHGSSMTDAASSFGNCGSGDAPTHFGGRVKLDTSMLGVGGKFTFNGGKAIADVAGVEIKSMKAEFKSGGSIEYSFPTAFNYGSGTKKTGQDNLKVMATANSAGGYYIDYLFPIARIDAQNEFVVYDPEAYGNVRNSAMSASASMIMVASLSVVASLLQ